MFRTPSSAKNGAEKNLKEKNNIIEENVESILKNSMPKSHEDIQWLTNIVEPEQQRGPSENP
ncbi:MAG: hypothetical protein GX958_10255 [Desulfitobacterium sp.]|nr:hypothetical protein [Desulfitobacterium sp.]